MSTSQGNDPAFREIIFQEELIDRLNKLLAYSPEVAADISKVFSAKFLCSQQTADHPDTPLVVVAELAQALNAVVVKRLHGLIDDGTLTDDRWPT